MEYKICNEPLSLVKRNKKVLAILSAGIIIVLSIIILISVIASSNSLERKLQAKKWYYLLSSGEDYIQYSFYDNRMYRYTSDNDAFKYGDWSINDNQLVWKWDESYSTFSNSYIELNDSDIANGLYTNIDNKWYVSDKYLFFEDRVFVSEDLFWDMFFMENR